MSDPTYPHGPPITAQSYSGANCQITAFIPPNSSSNRIEGAFHKFAELSTITMSSHRGVAPVRALGEHWVRDHVRGTRTFAGSLVFSVLAKDVFSDLYRLDRREGSSPYPPFVDQIPPFTIGIHALSELITGWRMDRGPTITHATMFLWGVQLTDWGQSMSIDDLYVETTYNYVAKWVTPFLPGDMVSNLQKITASIQTPAVKKASDLFQIQRKEI